jgi:hypothetical protein
MLDGGMNKMFLEQSVDVFYDSIFTDEKGFRFDLDGTSLPKELKEKDCMDVVYAIKGELGFYGANSYKRDADGDIISFHVSADSGSGWVKVIDGVKTQVGISGDYEDGVISGVVVSTLDIANKVAKLFEQSGYEINKRYD